MDTIKMGERGTLTLPDDLRERFGLQDGTLIVTDVKDGEIRLRPAGTGEPEHWPADRKAYFLLMNAMTREEWDRLVPDVVEMGIDPAQVQGIEPNHREGLPTDAEWTERARRAKALEIKQRLSA